MEAAQQAVAPNLSPSRFLQEQGGIEHIIQEAAKGVYSRGEKWGVAKALRGAVQGLQSANSSPRRSMDGKTRWLSDNGKKASDAPPTELLAKIHSLEERNKSLAKMLETAIDEMWSQQKDMKPPEGTNSGSDVLSLAIAKVQFVQVYLENSSMILPTDMPGSSNPGKHKPSGHPSAAVPTAPSSPHIAVDGSIDEKALRTKTKPKTQRPPGRTSDSPSRTPSTPPDAGHIKRPTLSQSPFSWMLGEEQQKSDFVATSPFSSSAAGRGRTGSIFGEDNKQRGRQDVDEDGDVFTSIGKRGDRGK